MISYREAAAGIYGAWRLARLDPHGMSYFDATERGFWHSFYAAVIVAPAYAVIVAIDYLQQPLGASEERIIAVQAIAYVISWTLFPLAMTVVARMLDRERYYLRYIVAANWANVLEVLLFLPAIAMADSGVAAFAMLPVLAALVTFAYQWFVARTALMVSGLQAAAVVGLDLLLDIALMVTVHAMLNGGAPA